MSDVDVDKAFNSLTDALSILMDLGNFPLHTNKLAEAIPVLRASLTATQEKLAAAEKENAHLRSALAVSKDPCIYCQLPTDEMAKCRSGFPGCARADDMTGCPEFGAMLNEAHLREQLTTAQAQIEAARNEGLEEAKTAAIKIGKQYTSSEAKALVLEFRVAIEALKSTAPVRDDARDERLINFAINAEVSYQRRVAVHRTAKEILAAFNTQDKP